MKTVSNYLLHIDREGFPVMENGLRADDESFLKSVFQNIHRFQQNDKQPLATFLDSREVLLSSFDDPLIAQSVSLVGSELFWSFLGEVSLSCQLTDLRVDEWNRFHAYLGPEKIPALMSHKAQSKFLLEHSEALIQEIKPFRGSSEVLDSNKWDGHYKSNKMSWDMGHLNPVVEKHSKHMIDHSGTSFLVPGAGSGHEIPFLEKAGKSVVALDFSPSAKKTFEKTYPSSKASYIVGDFFDYSSSPVDAILELAFFVAIDPHLRAQAVKKIYSLLKPGAFWGGCFITRYAEGGPPFGLNEWELQKHTEGLFEIVEWQRSPHSHPRRSHMELWALMRKL